MREAVIVDAVRTPLGRRNGKLKDLHPVVMGSMVLKELVRGAGIDPGLVDGGVVGGVRGAASPAHAVPPHGCRGAARPSPPPRGWPVRAGPASRRSTSPRTSSRA